MRSTPTEDERDQRNWTRWAYNPERGLYVVFPEVVDEDFELNLSFAERLYGSDNVVVGDAFDEKRRRTSEDGPGVDIYVTRDGLVYAEQRWLHDGVASAMQQLGDRVDVLEKGMKRHRLSQSRSRRDWGAQP
jgi:hypothetical protein